MSESPKLKYHTMRWSIRQARRVTSGVGGLLLLFVVGFALYAWVVNARGNRAMHRIQHELKKRELFDLYPNHLAGVGSWGVDVESGTAAAYWRAAMDAEPVAGERPLLSVGTVMVANIEPKQQYHPDMVAALRDVFETYPRFLQLVDDARKVKPGALNLIEKSYDPYSSLDVLGGTRSVARWLEERARLAEVESDGETFVHCFVSILDLSHLLSKEPHVISALVSTSIDALASDGIEQGLSRIKLNTAQLDQLLEALTRCHQSIDLIKLMADDLSQQYHIVGSDIQAHFKQYESRQSLFTQHLLQQDPEWANDIEEPSTITLLWRDLLLSTCPGRYELRHAKALDRQISDYDGLLKRQDQPAQRWAWMTTTIEERKRESDEDEDDDFRQIQSNDYLTIARTLMRMETRLVVLIAALQAERYRVENDQWPSKLIDATSKPAQDAYGQALRYLKTDDGVMLYSLGGNALDDDGYGQWDQDVPDKYLDPDDYAVNLYRPEERNSLPPPTEAIEPESDYDELWIEEEPANEED